MNHLTIALLAIIALLAGLLTGSAVLERQRRRSAPNHARLIAEPNSTLDLVTKDGRVIAKVVLNTITRNHTGTSVEFTDYYRYMERTTYRG